ncbi:MAG: alternative ribosome rescue aminoacyl-tRNA hydrolase ArfB [Pseudomonadota bacterium]
MPLRITATLTIPDAELHESFVHAGGPGGQNVNKVATAVQLRFDAAGSSVLPTTIARRALTLAGKRATKAGEIIIHASSARTQEQNRRHARARLAALLREAAIPPKPRIATRPSAAAKRRRLEEKSHRSATKRLRGRVSRNHD